MASDLFESYRTWTGGPLDPVRGLVVRQLAGDYPDPAMRWIRDPHTRWAGPQIVPLGQVDYSNAANWHAAQDPGRVTKFGRMIASGWEKPIILVRRPGETLLMIADGHHRALAYRGIGRDPLAFVAQVPSLHGQWDDFHDEQNERASG